MGDRKHIGPVPAAAATCMLLDREVFEAIGGFDERFFMYMEDTDLCKRLAEAGRQVYFVPEAGAVHRWGEGSAVSPLRKSWYHHRSVWKYFLKYYPNGFSVFILPVALLINFIGKACLSLFRKQTNGPVMW